VSESTQAVKIKRRRNRVEIEQLVAEYESSGLSRTDFCRQRGLSLSTLSRYRRRQEQAAGETPDGKRFLAVEVSGSAARVGGERANGLAIMVPGGRRIEVGRDFDAETLKRLLAVVERG
jgi:transposase